MLYMGFENSPMILTQIHPLNLFMWVFDAIKLYCQLKNPYQIVLVLNDVVRKNTLLNMFNFHIYIFHFFYIFLLSFSKLTIRMWALILFYVFAASQNIKQHSRRKVLKWASMLSISNLIFTILSHFFSSSSLSISSPSSSSSSLSSQLSPSFSSL